MKHSLTKTTKHKKNIQSKSQQLNTWKKLNLNTIFAQNNLTTIL